MSSSLAGGIWWPLAHSPGVTLSTTPMMKDRGRWSVEAIWQWASMITDKISGRPLANYLAIWTVRLTADREQTGNVLAHDLDEARIMNKEMISGHHSGGEASVRVLTPGLQALLRNFRVLQPAVGSNGTLKRLSWLVVVRFDHLEVGPYRRQQQLPRFSIVEQLVRRAVELAKPGNERLAREIVDRGAGARQVRRAAPGDE